MTPANVIATWGSQVQLGVEALSIPTISTLGAGGAYNDQADVRFVYVPANTIPFTVTATKRNSAGAGTSTALTDAQLSSLRQPVLVSGDRTAFCQTTPPLPAPPPGLTEVQILQALRTAIASQANPIAFSTVSTTRLTTGLPVIDALGLPPSQIASLAGGCFVSAPIQDPTMGVSFRNNRERSPGNNFRDMTLLQINLESLTLWNDQGFYMNGSTLTSANQLLNPVQLENYSFRSNA